MLQTSLPPPLTSAKRAPRPGRRAAGLAGAIAALVAAEPRALALQGGEDASTLPVLIDKQNGLAGKLQLSAMFSTTLATKFTESTGATLNVQYNFTDQFGIELVGGFYAASEAQILDEIRRQDDTVPPRDPQLSDMHQMQWLAAGNLVWVPLYGKISFASEWNPSFDLYLLAGGGVVGTRRNRATAFDGTTFTFDTESEVAPQFNFGGGLRIFIIPALAIRLEVRNYFYVDPDAGEPTFTATQTGSNDEISGLTNALVGQIGLQWTIGGGQ